MATSNKGGIIVSSGSQSPQTQSPSAGSGELVINPSMTPGPAPTMPPDLVTPLDQSDSLAGQETTGAITQQSSGSAQAMNQGVATEPPTVHPDTPYTGTGVVNKQPPTSGGPSQAVPKTGLS